MLSNYHGTARDPRDVSHIGGGYIPVAYYMPVVEPGPIYPVYPPFASYYVVPQTMAMGYPVSTSPLPAPQSNLVAVDFNRFYSDNSKISPAVVAISSTADLPRSSTAVLKEVAQPEKPVITMEAPANDQDNEIAASAPFVTPSPDDSRKEAVAVVDSVTRPATCPVDRPPSLYNAVISSMFLDDSDDDKSNNDNNSGNTATSVSFVPKPSSAAGITQARTRAKQSDSVSGESVSEQLSNILERLQNSPSPQLIPEVNRFIVNVKNFSDSQLEQLYDELKTKEVVYPQAIKSLNKERALRYEAKKMQRLRDDEVLELFKCEQTDFFTVKLRCRLPDDWRLAFLAAIRTSRKDLVAAIYKHQYDVDSVPLFNPFNIHILSITACYSNDLDYTRWVSQYVRPIACYYRTSTDGLYSIVTDYLYCCAEPPKIDVFKQLLEYLGKANFDKKFVNPEHASDAVERNAPLYLGKPTFSVMDLCVVRGFAEGVEFLYRNHSISLDYSSNAPALAFLAVLYNQAASLKKLHELGASLKNIVDGNGNNLLDIALVCSRVRQDRMNYSELIKYLVDVVQLPTKLKQGEVEAALIGMKSKGYIEESDRQAYTVKILSNREDLHRIQQYFVDSEATGYFRDCFEGLTRPKKGRAR